jgi:LAO/AO transport system kinase
LKPKDSALSIQPGVEPSAAPAMAPGKRSRRPRLSREEYVNGVLRGDRTVLAQAITLIESLRPEDSPMAQEILEACLPHTGNSIRVGITGVPGVGKSTFIEALGTHLTKERGEKTAVLAVDPSSQVSGGSILGDKTRMEGLANDPLAFIRPSASGGSLGGVARRTRETLLLCEAAGYQNVLVETVGVGQSETVVRAMVDFFLLLMLPGAGDELQGMKRGIMELTDLIAINKADGDDRIKAQVARREYENALHLLPASPTGWSPRVVTCSAQAREGISEVWTIVLEHNLWLRQHGLLEAVRREQVRRWMDEMIRNELLRRFRSHPLVRERWPDIEREVVEGRLSSFRAVEQLLDSYYKAK